MITRRSLCGLVVGLVSLLFGAMVGWEDVVANVGDVYRLSGENASGHPSNGIAGITFDSILPNTRPIATDGDYTTPEDTSVTGNIISEDSGYGIDSDIDGDSLAVYTYTLPVTGTLALQTDGTFSYMPSTNWSGVVTYTYVVSDGNLFNIGDGTVAGEQKISDTAGGFGGVLNNSDYFGYSLTHLGDLDGDGVGDVAVGAYGDDDGGDSRGAVWILFLNSDGTVKSEQKISDTMGGFGGVLDDSDLFGSALANLGDLDGDGVVDMAVGAYFDDDGGINRGAVWILFLNSDGTVKSEQKISATMGGFGGVLDSDLFGNALANLGDLDGDGVVDVAVGAYADDDGGSNRGAVWILFLNSDGTVKSEQKISATMGGFGGVLDDSDLFGSAIAHLGDLDGDGVVDMAVGAYADDDGGSNRGAVWILFLNSDGTVKSEQKISATEGGFGGVLDDSDYFGNALANLGDLDGDGVGDMAVGAYFDDDGGSYRGAVWVLNMNSIGITATSNTAVVTVTVTAVNDPPLAVDDAYTTTENIPLVVTGSGVLGNDTDLVEGDGFTAELVDNVLSGTLDLRANGTFTFTPAVDTSGVVTFTYYANDGDNSNLATVTVEVEPCVVVPVLGPVTIDVNGNDALLGWEMTPNAAIYNIWSSPTDPYFTIGGGDSSLLEAVNGSLLSWSHLAVVGDGNHYYYRVLAESSCGGESNESKRMGKFDYSLMVGQ
ncbi:MAG TPA: Ig-like domain-containing protein [Anaerolineae bacterium]|nr:Ig-like domain-containing protein [Anaerolineae bacterium]